MPYICGTVCIHFVMHISVRKINDTDIHIKLVL